MTKYQFTIDPYQIVTNERFDFTLMTSDAYTDVIQNTPNGCFGKLTHAISGTKLIDHLHVDIHMLVYDNTTLDFPLLSKYLLPPHGIRQTITNATVIDSMDSFHKELIWLSNYLQRYVAFHRYDQESIRVWTHSTYISETNYIVHFDFSRCYMWEVFFVLNCFRRLWQLTTRPYYYLAKQLYEQRWHNLDFVNILLLTDLSTMVVPNDQRIGHFFMDTNCETWISPDTMQETRNQIAQNANCFKLNSLSGLIMPVVKHKAAGYYKSWSQVDLVPKNYNDVLTLQPDASKMEDIYNLVNHQKYGQNIH